MIGYAWHSVHDVVQRNPVLDRFLYEMAQSLESKGYHVLTFAQREPGEARGYADLVRTSRVDGFVLSDTTYDDPRIRRLLELDIPFACFGRSNPEWDFPYADDDGQRGLSLVVQHLLDQGHRRIAMLGWPKGSMVGEIRVLGYQQALQAAGIEAHPDLLVRTANDVPHAAQAAALVLSRTPRPTAIICASDIIAIGVRMHLESTGIRMGADVAVASYDDTPVAQALDLTSVHQQIDVVAHAVTDLLIGRIRNTPVAPQQILVPPNLIVRSSSTGHAPR
jgi:LacI family transcriptional regulator